MISKKLVNAVHKEAANLRDNVPLTERRRLVFKRFDPRKMTECVYGQMTGHCGTERARELLTTCAPFSIRGSDFDNPSCELEPVDKDLMNGQDELPWTISYYSPIETYIVQDGADNQQLVHYLKGKIDTLDLTPTINC